MKRQMMAIILLLAGMLLFTACTGQQFGGVAAQEGETASKEVHAKGQADIYEEESTADLTDTADKIYMVIKNDSFNYQMTLMDLSNDTQICYEYTDGTEFFDKYGNYDLSEAFSEGKLVTIQRLNSNDTLGALAATDATWCYEDVRKYTIDTEKSRIAIAGTSYRYDDLLHVFSGGEEVDLNAVGENDTLHIYGIGRTVYSIVIASGHGTLALTNTKLFEGGWLNLGTKVYTTITRDMAMELPEGVYEFAVANDGYGDSGEIRIRRGKTTIIDLDDYKGEGPKMCKLSFRVSVDGAILTLNGKVIDASKAQELRYGVYTLGVYADGYQDWTRQIVINSPTARIDILLSEATSASEQQESSSQAASNDTAQAGSKAGSLAGSHGSASGSNSNGTSNNSDNSALANAALSSSLASIITGGDSTDYLDTLSSLLKSLDRLGGSSSSDNAD